MHFLARFTPKVKACGVWSDGAELTAIEAYPSACKRSPLFDDLLRQYGDAGLDHQDKRDALTCALIAWAFTHRREALMPPRPDVPASEGWIPSFIKQGLHMQPCFRPRTGRCG